MALHGSPETLSVLISIATFSDFNLKSEFQALNIEMKWLKDDWGYSKVNLLIDIFLAAQGALINIDVFEISTQADKTSVSKSE